MKRLLFLLGLFLLLSCSEDFPGEGLGANASVIGTWVEVPEDAIPENYEETAVLGRESQLADDRYGFVIEEDGTFLERKNAGWCGTPPITYANYEGSWEALSDSLLQITVGYWGGVMNYQMRIVELQDELLVIRYLSVEERAEAK